MDSESCREHCLTYRAVAEEFPFGPDTLVFKVAGKIFALMSLDHVPLKISLKCDPARALGLREQYIGKITGAYHMNKKHWNSLLPQTLPPDLVKDLIDHSYDLVVGGLTKKQQQEFQNLDHH